MSDYKQPLIDALKAGLIKLDQSFNLAAVKKLTIKLDGKFRKVPVLASQEFLISHAYGGSRGKIILEFTPMNGPGTYDTVEMSLEEALDDMSGFAEAVDTVVACFESEPLAKTWPHGADIPQILAHLKLAAEAAEVREQRQAEQQAAIALVEDADNPHWGQF